MKFLSSMLVGVLLLWLCKVDHAFSPIRIQRVPHKSFHDHQSTVYRSSKSFGDHVSASLHSYRLPTREEIVIMYRNTIPKLNQQFFSKKNVDTHGYEKEVANSNSNNKDSRTEMLLKEILNLKSRVDLLERTLTATKPTSPFLSSMVNNYFQQKKMALGRDFLIFRVANTSLVQRIAFMLGYVIIGAALASLLSKDLWYIGALVGALHGLFAGNLNGINNIDTNLFTTSRIQKYFGKNIFFFLQFLRYQLEQQNIFPQAKIQKQRTTSSSWRNQLFNLFNRNTNDENISTDEYLSMSRNSTIITRKLDSLNSDWSNSQGKLQNWTNQISLENKWDQCMDSVRPVLTYINAHVSSILRVIITNKGNNNTSNNFMDNRYRSVLTSSSNVNNSNSKKLDLLNALMMLQRYATVSFCVYLTWNVAQRVYTVIKAQKDDY